MRSGLANVPEAKLRRGPGCGRASGPTLAATNDLSAGSVCKRRDAVTLGRKKGLQPRANERPADSFSFKLGRLPRRASQHPFGSVACCYGEDGKLMSHALLPSRPRGDYTRWIKTASFELIKTLAVGTVVTVFGTVIATLCIRALKLDRTPAPAPVVVAAVAPKLTLPRFTSTIDSGADCAAFDEFLSENLGKLVDVRVEASAVFSHAYRDSDGGSLSFRSDAPDDPAPLEQRCSDFRCHITGDGYQVYWYNTGYNRLNGFFVVAPDIAWQQGKNFGLRAVAPESVLLRTQVE